MQIDQEKIHFSHKSMRDGFGRVFFKNNEIFRAIFPQESKTCEALLSSVLFKELSDKGWIPRTTISDLQVAGFSQVLHHERLTEIAQHEWSFSMLKDAALRVWDINQLCNRHGYELKDGHTLNVLFRGTEPVWSDLGSIAKQNSTTNWIAYEEYLSSFVVPLICWSKGVTYVSRKLLESHFYGIVTLPSQRLVDSGILEMIPDFPLHYHFAVKRKKLFHLSSDNRFLKSISKLGNKIVSVLIGRPSSFFSFDFDRRSLPDVSPFFEPGKFRSNLEALKSPAQTSAWNAYHSQFYRSGDAINYSSRFLTLASIIQARSEIRSVIDLAGNEGFFCLLLTENKNLESIILTDYDSNAIDSGYQRFKALADKRVSTAFLNFMFTPGQEETQVRLKADLAVALAVTHHLLLGNKYSLQVIFERLSGFSDKYVLTEFMPLGLWAAGEEVKALPDWYTIDWFRKHFMEYFELLEEKKTEDNRILFFGKKKASA